MFDWSKVTGQTGVYCKTGAEANAFMVECEKHGLKWNMTGSDPTSRSHYEECPDGTVYWTSGSLTYGSLAYARGKGSPVLEFSDLCKPGLPRICEILCPERPLEDDEEFGLNGHSFKLRVHKGVIQFVHPDFGWESASAELIADAINHPEKIIRRPQFSEIEIAFLQAFYAIGYDFWVRNEVGLFACMGKPLMADNGYPNGMKTSFWVMPEAIFPSLPVGSLIKATDYLKSST
jgi:hypothetical protein